jgi:NitT/TauT family transport system ATP-binding protein
MSAKIEIEHITKTFPARAGRGGGRGRRGAGRTDADQALVAIDDVDFAVDDGEFLVLVGPSGCGKSTLLDLLGGLTRPTGGRVLLDGREIDGPGLDRGIVFQQYALFPWRTAQANVEFGLQAKGVPRAERRERAREFLRLVGLSGFEDRYPHELSGGMKQRVAIARSLAYDPEVLLMDEPFAALDAQTREVLQGELLRIWRQTGKTIIFITHGIDEAVFLGQRVLVLSARPGTVKADLTIDLPGRETATDLRSTPEFARERHRVWSLLHDEVAQAAEPEGGAPADAATARDGDRDPDREPDHGPGNGATGAAAADGRTAPGRVTVGV